MIVCSFNVNPDKSGNLIRCQNPVKWKVEGGKRVYEKFCEEHTMSSEPHTSTADVTKLHRNVHPASVILTYDESWSAPTPCFIKDIDEGTAIVLEHLIPCPTCGMPARRRMSYTWAGSQLQREGYRLNYGDSLKHYYTCCTGNHDHDQYS